MQVYLNSNQVHNLENIYWKIHVVQILIALIFHCADVLNRTSCNRRPTVGLL